MCPKNWKRVYEGMIRTIATWVAELGWGGQRDWEYQALRKTTTAMQGTSGDVVNHIGVEDVRTTSTTARLDSWDGV